MKIYAQETYRMPERGLDDLLALKPVPPVKSPNHLRSREWRTLRIPERGFDDILALKPMPPRQVASKKKDKPSSSKK